MCRPYPCRCLPLAIGGLDTTVVVVLILLPSTTTIMTTTTERGLFPILPQEDVE